MHLLGIFSDSVEIGGLVDTLKNSGIQRRDMIISTFDEEKFAKMAETTESSVPSVKSDKEDFGALGTFLEVVRGLHENNGIVVSVKAPRHKAQEVKSVMEQSGALEIVVQ